MEKVKKQSGAFAVVSQKVNFKNCNDVNFAHVSKNWRNSSAVQSFKVDRTGKSKSNFWQSK